MISLKKIAILNALAKYKFLTRIQFAKLGVEKYNSAFSRHLKPLVEAKYLGVIDATQFSFGYIYYLNKKGAIFTSKLINKSLDQISYCINKPDLSPQSLFHRTASIDCQIELFCTCSLANVDILFYDRDIETLGNIKRDNNLTRKTRIKINNNKFLEPDAIFLLETLRGNKLYCLEYEHKDYTKKSFQQALAHVQALNLKSPSIKYNHDKAHRTLFIYKNKSTMLSVMDHIKESITGINNWFLFKTYDEVNSGGKFENAIFQNKVKKNFFESWRTCNGKRVSLY